MAYGIVISASSCSVMLRKVSAVCAFLSVLLYCFNIMCIELNTVHAMNRLLAKVEQCALYHGLNFNRTKCVNMIFHCKEKRNTRTDH